MDKKSLCAECGSDATHLSFGPDQKEVVLICSQVCSDKFWTKKQASGQDQIGFLVSSDPGFVPGADPDALDRTVRNVLKLPYAPAHQWFTQEGVRRFENEYATLKFAQRTPKDVAEEYDDEIPRARFNYFVGLRHLYVKASAKFPDVYPPVTRQDLDFYHFSGRALVAGVIWNDAPSFYKGDASPWKKYIEKDVRVGDESYTKRLMSVYGLTYEDYSLSQEFHYNPSVSKIIALAMFGVQSKLISFVDEKLAEYYVGDHIKKLGLKAREWSEWVLPFIVKAGLAAKNAGDFAKNMAQNALDKSAPTAVKNFFTDPYNVRQIQNAISWLPVFGVANSWITQQALQQGASIPMALNDHWPWVEASAKWSIQLFQRDQDVMDAQGDPAFQKWHSMSRPYSFKDTNESLRKEIAGLLTGWFEEAIETASLFALGHVFHCIEDSYSRSHTRRAIRYKTATVVRKLPGDYTIQMVRHTKLITFQQYEDEGDHAPSDSWISAIGRDPVTGKVTEEFMARRDECISVLAAVASLYYYYFTRVAKAISTNDQLKALKKDVSDAFYDLILEGPYMIEARDKDTLTGGSYESIMRKSILYRVCKTGRDGESEAFCIPASPEEEAILKEKEFNIKVNMTLNEERKTKRYVVRAKPSWDENKLKGAIIEKLANEGIVADPADLRIYFTEDDFGDTSQKPDVVPRNLFGAWTLFGIAWGASLYVLKKGDVLASKHLKNNAEIWVEKQRDIARSPVVTTLKEFLDTHAEIIAGASGM